MVWQTTLEAQAKNFFIFLKDCLKKKKEETNKQTKEQNKECATICGLRRQKYLFSGALQKMFANFQPK